MAIKFQLGRVDPMVSIVYRFLLASVLMLIYCFLSKKNMRFGIREHGLMFLQGACLFSLNFLFLYHSEISLTSGLAAVIFSTIVIMNMVNGSLFLGNRFELRMLLGAVIGLLGITLVFWEDLFEFEFGNENLPSILLAFGMTFLTSLGNIISFRNKFYGIPIIQANTFGMIYGTLIMIVIALVSGKAFTIDYSILYIVSLGWLVIFASIVAFWSYLTLISRVGVDRGAYATLFYPLVALGLSTIFENYEWTNLAIVGFIFIFSGNLIIFRR